MFDIEPALLPGERIRILSRPHPIALVRVAAVRLAQVVGIWILVRAAALPVIDTVLNLPFLHDLGPGGGPIPLGEWVGKLGLLLFLGVLAGLALDALRWLLTRYALTDQRILQMRGVWLRETVDSPLDRVDDILLLQSWLGERLDYGDLVVLRGEQPGNHLAAMKGPRTFHQAMHAARVGRSARRTGDTAARERPVLGGGA